MRKALDREGLPVPLSGPDWTDLPELKPQEIDFDPFIGAYDLHSYFARFDWQTGQGYPLVEAEKRLKSWKQWAQERGKPLFLSELGSMVFGWGGGHPGPSTFDAAIKDAELVVRALNAGVDGFNRWSFINRGDLDGQWQMIDTWDPVEEDTAQVVSAEAKRLLCVWPDLSPDGQALHPGGHGSRGRPNQRNEPRVRRRSPQSEGPKHLDHRQ